MGTTTKYAFPYPALSDSANAPSQVQSLAQKVEDVLGDGLLASIAYTPTWTAATSGTPTVGTGGNAAFGGYYHASGKWVDVLIGLKMGTTGISSGTGAWSFGLPSSFTARQPGAAYNTRTVGGWTVVDASTGDRYMGFVLLTGSTVVQCINGLSSISVLQVNNPISGGWAADDTLIMQFRTEVA